MMDKKLAVALIVKPQGIKGEIKLKPLGNGPSELLDIKNVFLSESDENAVEVKKVWAYKDNAFMALEGITTRNEAETLRGKTVFIGIEDVKDLEEGVYYLSDLIGCMLKDENGNKLGSIKEILQNGSTDVYVVKGEKSFMMPALKKVIMNTDIASKTITVDEKALAEVTVYED